MYTETARTDRTRRQRGRPSPPPRRRRNLGHRILGSGLIEALAAPHGADRYLELVRPGWSVRELRAEVTAVHHPAPDSVTLTLRPNHLWRGHEPGQFVRCTVEIDGVRRARCYSPASSAHRSDGMLELTARAHPEGLVSRFLHEHAAPGMVVGLEPAAGDFVLSAERPDRLALISGGSGITPVMSMLRTLIEEDHRGEIAFLHYARNPDRVPYARELAQIAVQAPGVNVAFAYTRGARGGGPQGARGNGLAGHFSLDHLSAIAPELAATEIYVCGPAGLIDAVRAACNPERVHSESFVPRRRRGCQLRPQRHRRPEQWGDAARTGGGRRPEARPRLPHGHLPHLHLPQARRRCPQRRDRRDLLNRGRGHPDLRVGARG